MKRKIFTALCVATALASCAKSEEGLTGGDSDLKVSVDPIIKSRATELNFESGDQIGVMITMESDNTLFADNALMSYNGSSFTGDLLWYSDTDQSSTLTAYYPYVAGESFPTTFTIQADQTVEGAYTASDLMVASKSEVTPSASSTVMTFSHSLSRVVMEVDNQSGQAISSIEVCGSLPTATLDLASLSIVADETSVATDIKAPLWDDGTYKAIIVPQSVALTFKATLADGSELSVDKGSVVFVAGGEYTAEVVLSDGTISVSLSGDINDWTEGGIIPDVVSFTDYADDEYFEYDGVIYNTITFENGSRWMTENLRYVPANYSIADDATVASEMWYPYKMDYEKLVEDDKVALSPSIDYLVVLKDDASIAAKGYLYSVAAALGIEEITVENCYNYEGAQGVCPAGWHIPTRADYYALVGNSIAAVDESGTQTNPDALFYDSSYQSAPIGKVIEGGFNYIFSGIRMQSTFSATPVYQRTMIQSSNSTVEEYYGETALNYYMTSTCYQPAYSSSTGLLSNIQYFGLMSTFTASGYPEGRLSLAAVGVMSGMPVRCVKDVE